MATETSAPSTSTPAPAPSAPPAATTAADAMSIDPPKAEDKNSLQNLIQHCDTLGKAKKAEEERVKQLTEIVERLKGRLTDINMESSTKELENVVRPWLAEVGVKDNDIQSMLEGAMAAQKRIIDAQIMPPDGAPIPPMERNNVIEVMCSAAAAHGRKVQELEDARAEIATLKQSMQDEQSIQRVISRGPAEDTSLGKRANPDPAGPYERSAMSSSSECWSNLFESVGRGR